MTIFHRTVHEFEIYFDPGSLENEERIQTFAFEQEVNAEDITAARATVKLAWVEFQGLSPCSYACVTVKSESAELGDAVARKIHRYIKRFKQARFDP